MEGKVSTKIISPVGSILRNMLNECAYCYCVHLHMISMCQNVTLEIVNLLDSCSSKPSQRYVTVQQQKLF